MCERRTAVSGNLRKGVEGKIKEGVGWFGFLLVCQQVSGALEGIGRLAVSCRSGAASAT